MVDSAADQIASPAAAGDRVTFTHLVQRHEYELHVHCYRMLASIEDAEDMVQETFTRAWAKRESCRDASAVRAWLYTIATNVCLDFLRRRPDRRVVTKLAPAGVLPPPVSLTWLQPFPHETMHRTPASDASPDDVVVRRETLELAFLTALQHLPPKQRSVHILRDVLGWSAKEVAASLDSTVAGVNSALQRARETLRFHLPSNRLEWSPSEANEEERAVLKLYVEATEASDIDALVALLHEDARCGQQPGASGHPGPDPAWYSGRRTIKNAWAPALEGDDAVSLRLVPTWANTQPAAGVYFWDVRDALWRPFGLDVLDIKDGKIREISAFVPEVFATFGLPQVLA